MTLSLLHKLGDWNAQLFREASGRLKSRNVAIATVFSLFSQSLLMLYFYLQLPGQESGYSYYSLKDAAFNSIPGTVDWQRWWLDVFRVWNWVGALILLLGGVYMLISDVSQEERRGTLNFIRLSPQTSQSILTGKILGVPVLLYLAILLGLPLHLWAAQSAGLDVASVFAYYALLVVTCGSFYSGALLYALAGGFQAWLGTLLASILLFPSIQVLNFFSFFFHVLKTQPDYWQHTALAQFRWFYLPIASNFVVAYSFTLFTIALLTYWIWQFVNRRFQNPNATILSKQQSYLLITCVHLWMLGFAMPDLKSASYEAHLSVGFVFLFFVVPGYFVILIGALSPHRQSLQDWARYQTRNWKTSGGRAQLLRDLLLGEKSPALLAIATNLLITAAIWSPWMLLLWPKTLSASFHYKWVQILASLVLTANILLIGAAIAQLMLLVKVRKSQLWAAGAVTATLTVPLVIAGVLYAGPDKMPELWLVSVFPVFAIQQASTLSIILTFLAQVGVMTFLTLRLTRTLKKAGESESKALLASR